MQQLSLPFIDGEEQIFDEAYKMYRCGTVDFFAESFTLFVLPLVEAYLVRVSPDTQLPDAECDRRLIVAAKDMALKCYCTDRAKDFFALFTHVADLEPIEIPNTLEQLSAHLLLQTMRALLLWRTEWFTVKKEEWAALEESVEVPVD